MARPAAAKGNHGGRPKVIDDDMLLFARALKDKCTPIPEIAKKLSIKTGKNPGKTPPSHPSTAPWQKPTRGRPRHAPDQALPQFKINSWRFSCLPWLPSR